MFEIGNSLREARLRQQLDFPELEQQTKIRAKYLKALEDEDFDVLPAPRCRDMRSSGCSAPAGWARSISRATCGYSAT